MNSERDPSGLSPHTPGAKLDAHKLRPMLVLGGFARALTAVTAIGTFGARKYTDHGWKQVDKGYTRYTEAMMRHLLKELSDELVDPDSEMLHAAHTAWNALARLELLLTDKIDVEVDDGQPTSAYTNQDPDLR